jgi:putative DNA primase/helicase
VLDATDPAAFVAAETVQKPQLRVHYGDLSATALAVRDLLAGSGRLYDRGVPVRVVTPTDGGLPFASPLTKHGVVMETHALCEPVRIIGNGQLHPVTLPDRVAQMYLDMLHNWKLEPLAGISTAPLLSADGGIRAATGYDPDTKLWCAYSLPLDIPTHPNLEDAQRALDLLRRTFRTFPFADAARRSEQGVDVVYLDEAPEFDESAFLVALMTAVCRQSLWLSPGFLATAASVSGAGSGKGLLVRATCAIAYGLRPSAFTAGGDRKELDKRLAAELIEAQPVVFLDNVNGVSLRSDTLASALTERPCRVRQLGQTRMLQMSSTAFIAVTGNGLTVTEDLARRFIHCELDARCEDPEMRSFPAGFLKEIEHNRAVLLGAVLTIWRWGRQRGRELARGKPLGSFETWAEWCRDPLLDLGCRDPVERIGTLKSKDPQRQRISELFITWWAHHRSAPITANDLAFQVKNILDPQGRGRHYQAAFLVRLDGTRAAGFVLSRQEPAGKWTAATYALAQDAPRDRNGHDPHQSQAANGHAHWPG